MLIVKTVLYGEKRDPVHHRGANVDHIYFRNFVPWYSLCYFCRSHFVTMSWIKFIAILSCVSLKTGTETKPKEISPFQSNFAITIFFRGG
jgi:hypothetical protein